MKIVVFISIVFLSAFANANVIGNDAQNFNPTSNGLDYITVQSSDTLNPGVGNVGVFLNYAYNSLPFLDGSTQKLKNDRLLTSDWSVGLGLMDSWDIGFNMPYQLSQEIDCTSCAFFKTTGVTDYKVNSKIRLKQGGPEKFGFAVVLFSIFDSTENNPYAGKNPGPSYGGELIADRLIGDYKLALNFGHRWRTPGERFPSDPADGSLNDYISRVPNSYTYSLGVSRFHEPWDTNFIFEIYGSSLSQSEIQDGNRSDRGTSSLEALLGAKKVFSEKFAVHFGAGTELVHGFGTPALRFYTGLNWSFGPLWSQPEEPKNPSSGVQAPNAPVAFQNSELVITDTKEYQKVTLKNLNFQFNTTDLDDSSLAEYNQVVESIVNDKTIKKVEVEGHTDSVGNDQYNSNLSRDRANSVKQKLLADSRRSDIAFEAVGYGESKPIADNRNFQGRLLNRRVVLNIYR